MHPPSRKIGQEAGSLSGWLKLRMDAEARSCPPPISPARERCETVGLLADSRRFCACAHRLLLPTSADSERSAEVNSCGCQHWARRCFLLVGAGFRRTGADGAGRRVCQLWPVLCPAGMEDQQEFREKRSGVDFKQAVKADESDYGAAFSDGPLPTQSLQTAAVPYCAVWYLRC